MPAGAHNWEGTLLSAGRYRVTSKLGEGGMGFVLRAVDDNLGTDVVIKMPHAFLMNTPGFAERFMREVRSLVRLAHPHILRILEVGQYEGLPFAVMQYLAGGSMEDRRRKNAQGSFQPVPADQVTGWLHDLSKALDYVHRQGYIHRDVKPHNILFDSDGNVYLSDFGLAKVVAEGGHDASTRHLTKTGAMIGTPHYMSPELLSDGACDGRSDQYALAVTVYELLAGRMPIDGTSPGAIIAAQLSKPPVDIRQILPQLPESLAAALSRALAKNRDQRFPDCVSFADAVGQALAKGSQRPQPKPLTQPQPKNQSQPQPKVQPQPQAKIEPQPQPKPKAQPQPQAQKQTPQPTFRTRQDITIISNEPARKGADTEPDIPRNTPVVEYRTRKHLEPFASSTHRKRRRLAAVALMLVSMALGAAGYLLITGRFKELKLDQWLQQWTHPPGKLEPAESPANPVEQPKPTPPDEGNQSQPLRQSVSHTTNKIELSVQQQSTNTASQSASPVQPSQSAATSPVKPSQQLASAVKVAPPDPIKKLPVETPKIPQQPGPQQPISQQPISQQPSPQQASSPAPTVKLPSLLITNSIDMKLAPIQAGEFMMGSNREEPGHQIDEWPVHLVRITKPFYLSICEVTQAEYLRVMQDNPSHFSHIGAGRAEVKSVNTTGIQPVENVNWSQAVAFCQRLGQLDKHVYRLPTEAEWEYACRGGTTTAYSYGNTLTSGQANFDHPGSTLGRPFRVGFYKANPWGLYDMHGNVREWCSDLHAIDYYNSSPTDDPPGPATGTKRVVRGGGFDLISTPMRSAYRSGLDPNQGYNSVGFRVVREVAASDELGPQSN